MNIKKLRARMVELGVTPDDLAHELKVCKSTLYRKFQRPEQMTVGDVRTLQTVLRLDDAEVILIFFS